MSQESVSLTLRRAARAVLRPVCLVALLAILLPLASASSAQAVISGGFCTVFLPSGGTCHGNYHVNISEIGGDGTRNNPYIAHMATCVGVDATPSGGNITNLCSAGAITCTTYCAATGYGYVHNHDGTYNGNYTGWITARS
jgi:hypothetical protein